MRNNQSASVSYNIFLTKLRFDNVQSFQTIVHRNDFAGMDTLENADYWFNNPSHWTDEENAHLELQKGKQQSKQSGGNCEELFGKKLGRDKSILEEPHKIQTLRGVIVYEWMLSKAKGFRVTVGHPYALLPYLKDPVKFPWIVVAVFNKANNDGETTVADISKLRGKKNNPQKYAQSLKAEF
jgi:hypothetical protein